MKGFTNLYDINKLIILYLEEKSLISVLQVNHYLRNIIIPILPKTPRMIDLLCIMKISYWPRW